MNRVFLLGARGFVGSHLVRKLEALSIPYSTAGREGSEIYIDLEVEDSLQNAKSIPAGSIFYFLAAISSPDRCNNDYESAYQVNVRCAEKLINILLRQDVKIVFLSSDAVLGLDKSPLPSERLSYAQMKFHIERTFENEGNFKVARLSYVLGRGDKFTEQISDYLRKPTTEPFSIFAGFKRNIVGVSDVVEGLLKYREAWSVAPACVNFCGQFSIAREEVARELQRQCFEQLRYSVVDAPPKFWMNRRQVIENDCTTFSSLLGRSPRDLRDIIREYKDDRL